MLKRNHILSKIVTFSVHFNDTSEIRKLGLFLNLKKQNDPHHTY